MKTSLNLISKINVGDSFKWVRQARGLRAAHFDITIKIINIDADKIEAVFITNTYSTRHVNTIITFLRNCKEWKDFTQGKCLYFKKISFISRFEQLQKLLSQ